MDGEALPEYFDEPDFCHETTNFPASADDIFSVLEAWDNASDYYNNYPVTALVNSPAATGAQEKNGSFDFQKSCYLNSCPLVSGDAYQESETEIEAASPECRKRKKLNAPVTTPATSGSQVEEGQQRMSHITVERNRRKQMNEHLSVLRSLMPCFYVKRGDQASIIGGVVNYINELQQVLQSLEAKKQRKAAFTEVLSPKIVSSPRPSQLSPRKPPLSPRLNLPISPRTPQSCSLYKPLMHQQQPSLVNSTSLPSPVDPSPCNSSTSSSINDAVNELVASSISSVAEVEVKFSGANLLLKTVSHHIPGQVLKIASALEEHALEILHVRLTTVDETMLYSFTIKVGIECHLSAEELAQQIQLTFC